MSVFPPFSGAYIYNDKFSTSASLFCGKLELQGIWNLLQLSAECRRDLERGVNQKTI